MNIDEVLLGLDKLFEKREIEKVEQYLMDNLSMAMEEEDISSVITLLNEMIGYCRDTSQYEKAVDYSRQVINLMKQVGLEGTIPYGTTLINVANAYRAAGVLEESLDLFIEVFHIYEGNLEKTDFRYASLNNNLSLLYQEMKDYEKSVECLKKALDIALLYEEAQKEVATTYTNLATSLVKLNRYDEAKDYLQKAFVIFDKDDEKDFHYSGALSTMADVCFLVGDFCEAINYYENALNELFLHVGYNQSYDIAEANLNRVFEELGYTKEQIEEKNTTRKEQEKLTKHKTKTDLEIKLSGIELCRAFYEEYGKPMICNQFSDFEDQIAVGIVGEGSECFGFDDEYSYDHDYGPGFCLWITKELDEIIGKQLRIAYDNLPTTFKGITRKTTKEGSHRVGVWIIEEFYYTILGKLSVPFSKYDWLDVEDYQLATATNGEIFVDKLGIFTEFRNKLLNYYPMDVWRIKLANNVALMAQTGQYNYSRMLQREEYVTAQIILSEYMKHTMSVVYLLNKSYAPFYKWMHKGMDKLAILPEIMDILIAIDDMPKRDERIPLVIEIIATLIVNELKNQKISMVEDNYLGAHVDSIIQVREGEESLDLNSIEAIENDLKNNLVDTIVDLEWKAFDKVENQGGRATCQNDWETFSIMRRSQYATWNESMLNSFIADFRNANQRGWNLITEKYGRMMKSTSPQEYEKIKESFPVISSEKEAIIEEIIKIQVKWMEEFSSKYPKSAGNARIIHTREDAIDNTSYETYLRGELSTYSDNTLELYGRFIVTLLQEGKNLAEMIMENTAILYDYASLVDLENRL